MNERELRRLKIIDDIETQRLSVVQGADLAGLSRRQMTRLMKVFKKQGVRGLLSKKRGQPSNRRYSSAFRDYVLDLIRQNYADFGPTLALEKLSASHDISLSKETLRKWMSGAGIWKTRKERRSRVYQPRNRRDCFGELIQIDGSHHWWFEGRGPKCAFQEYDSLDGAMCHKEQRTLSKSLGICDGRGGKR